MTENRTNVTARQAKSGRTRDLLKRRYKLSDQDLRKAREQSNVAEQIYRLRTELGMTQREFADRVGMKTSTICRLEDADYDGHSMRTLRRIAEAFDYRVEISLVPAP